MKATISVYMNPPTVTTTKTGGEKSTSCKTTEQTLYHTQQLYDCCGGPLPEIQFTLNQEKY